ncbi:MAG: SUMF1/EgtB/PvdO family nonheme iron enzyme [Fuerstiella sp.]|nr:SUMF1/EgtB/PvdO family nonheme iron enzyme [Fuerstiella sp.]MCP4856084.1 SUMF1/EgtB/PvdO family nonheme iron enzyme [Fuerstiella sp.]
MTSDLEGIALDTSGSQKQREVAALALANYCRETPEKLINVVLTSDDATVFRALVDALQPHAADVREPLVAAALAPMPANPSVEERDAHWRQQSLAAVTLVYLGHGDDVWSLLKFTPDPSLRSYIIHHLGRFQADQNTLAERLEIEQDVTVRRALIQSLGGLDTADTPSSNRQQIVATLQEMYVDDTAPGVHGSAAWTLRQWGEQVPQLKPTVGEPFAKAQEQWDSLRNAVDLARSRLDAFNHTERHALQAVWERKVREQPQEMPAAFNEGLITHYPFDETDGLQARNTVKDEPVGVYHGDGRIEWVPGVVGSAMRLVGEGQLIGGRPLTLSGDGPFSYGCWMFHEQGLPAVLLSSRNTTRATGFDVRIDSDQHLQVIISGEPPGVLSEFERSNYSEYYLEGTTAVDMDLEGIPGWRHVLITYDGSGRGDGVSFYLDGRRVESRVERDLLEGSTRANAPVYVGSRPKSGYFEGVIDDVRIFNRELTANDVEQLYQWSVESLARLSANQRTAEQQALLQRYFATGGRRARQLQRDLVAAETALQNNRLWYVNSQGQTMAVFYDVGVSSNDKQVKHFAISNCEVTFAEYKHFLRASRIVVPLPPNHDRPVHRVNWFQAAAYCNWLSQQDGISRDQWVYEPSDRNSYGDGMKIKPDYADLIGYRLPTGAEWEYACRAGAIGTYSFGEPQSLLQNYSQYIANAGGHSRRVGSLLPNEAGLFDMQGNVWEWTLDPTVGEMSPVKATTARVLRGGAFYLDENVTLPGSLTNYVPAMEISNIGFRIARTWIPRE